MDSYYSDLDFFDLSNASEEEIKEIRTILNYSGTNGCVELPWDTPLTFAGNIPEEKTAAESDDENVEPDTATLLPVASDSLEGVVGQALLYAPTQPQQTFPAVLSGPPTQLNVQASTEVPAVEALVQQMPPISASSAVASHYPAPYLVPRTLPYLRAYPPVGVPLLTCSLPGELTHAPSPYAPFLPLATPIPAVAQPRLEKPVIDKESSEIRQKNKISSDRQFYHHRNRKKNLSNSNTSYYASPPDYVQGGVDAYQDSTPHEDQTLVAANVTTDRISAVPSSLPVVPVPVPPSNFSVTSGTLPLPSYPPGLHPIHYPQMSGPQGHTTQFYYVPVLHPHYSGYLPSASSHMMLPMSNINLTANNFHQQSAESVCSVASEANEDVNKSSESLTASVESNEKSENSLSVRAESGDHATSIINEVSKKENNEDSSSEAITHEKNDCVTDSHSSVGSDGPAESIAHNSPKSNVCCDEQENCVRISEKVYNDNSRCWADLFKDQRPEVNGLDRRPNEQSPVNDNSSLIKEMTNGKLYSVPNSNSVL